MKKILLLLIAVFVSLASFSQTPCNVCNGHGKLICSMCGGAGQVYQNYFDPMWGIWRIASYYCAGCWGMGTIYCLNCGGGGIVSTSRSNISFKSTSPVNHLEDKGKKCYNKSTHFETFKSGSYQITLSDRCINCKSQYRNHP